MTDGREVGTKMTEEEIAFEGTITETTTKRGGTETRTVDVIETVVCPRVDPSLDLSHCRHVLKVC